MILTPDLIPLLLQAAHFVPQFWIDDIYVFALLPLVVRDLIGQEVNIINLRDSRELIRSFGRGKHCFRQWGRFCGYSVIYHNRFDIQEVYILWHQILRERKNR